MFIVIFQSWPPLVECSSNQSISRGGCRLIRHKRCIPRKRGQEEGKKLEKGDFVFYELEIQWEILTLFFTFLFKPFPIYDRNIFKKSKDQSSCSTTCLSFKPFQGLKKVLIFPFVYYIGQCGEKPKLCSFSSQYFWPNVSLRLSPLVQTKLGQVCKTKPI